MAQRVLVMDQFVGPSPVDLQQHPLRFDELVREALDYNAELKHAWNKSKVLEVEDDYKPEWATTVYRADADGMAEVWKHRWDSSG